MELLFLTKASGILMPFAIVLGFVMNYIYKFLELIGIENVGGAIILFTLVVNIVMLPLTVKQQKYTKLSSVMNPEIQKIQKKYQGKNDDVSMRRMQAETQAVYKKYGTSTMGGCIYLLIQLPILFALYRVIYNIPAYIDSVYALYEPIANNILAAADGMTLANELIDELSLSTVSAFTSDTFTVNKVIDMLYKLTTSDWESFTEVFGSGVILADNVEELTRITSFIGGLNISDKPTANGWWPGILIPILAGVSQWASVKITSAQNGTSDSTGDDSADKMATQMKTMNTIMPIFSAWICFSLQIGIGLYWISSAVIRTIISICVNKYLDHVGVDRIVEKNRIKAKKKADRQREKKGGTSSDKFEEYAKTSTKNLDIDQIYKQRKSISELASTSVEGNVYTSGKSKSSTGGKSASAKTKESKAIESKSADTATAQNSQKTTGLVDQVSVKDEENTSSKKSSKSKKSGGKNTSDNSNIAAYANMLKKK